jgi:hypothetical protein
MFNLIILLATACIYVINVIHYYVINCTAKIQPAENLQFFGQSHIQIITVTTVWQQVCNLPHTLEKGAKDRSLPSQTASGFHYTPVRLTYWSE